MKKLWIFAVTSVLLMTGCLKKDTTCNYEDSPIVAPATEQLALEDSLTAHGITATKHPSGLYYTIQQPGSGTIVQNLCSVVSVFYKGSFMNGKGFDSSLAAPVGFQLGRVITGWQKGIPLVKKGGEITLYIPPSLGYGPTDIKDQNDNVVIPANSILIFNVKVNDIQ